MGRAGNAALATCHIQRPVRIAGNLAIFILGMRLDRVSKLQVRESIRSKARRQIGR